MIEIQHTDVLVLGGGAAGIAAAVGASRMGLKVTLLERNAYLGGKATAAAVGTICGLYEFNKTAQPKYIVKGFAKEFAEMLQESSGTKPLNNGSGLHYLPYNIETFKQLCLKLLNEHNVAVRLNSTLNKIDIGENLIRSAHLTVENTHFEMNVKSIVDCSGDSIISEAADLPLIKNDYYQAAAQVFTMAGVEEDNEARLGLILMKALRSAIDEKKLEDFYDRVYVVQGSLKKNTVSLKVGIPMAVTLQGSNASDIRRTAESFVHNLSIFLTSSVPAFKNASIESVAPEAGIRVGPRTMGKYVLTGEDVLSCKKFDDAVADGAWPIEEWEQHRRVNMRYFNLGDYYQVPAGCIQSATIDNLFMGGRNISASKEAIASARVMGICLQTGYAAGCLAAGYATGALQSTSINTIQNDQL